MYQLESLPGSFRRHRAPVSHSPRPPLPPRKPERAKPPTALFYRFIHKQKLRSPQPKRDREYRLHGGGVGVATFDVSQEVIAKESCPDSSRSEQIESFTD